MMCHLFLKTNPLAVRDRSGEIRHNFWPIGFACCDRFLRAGMFNARHLKIIGVKRLIDNDRIVPIAPRAHHGRRDISRTRPHGDANAHGPEQSGGKDACATALRTTRSTFVGGSASPKTMSAAAGAVSN